MERTFKVNFTISSYQIYPNRKLTLTSLLGFLQEAAALHAIRLNRGLKDLEKDNLTWVLSRMFLKVDKWPELGETVIIETWPKGFDRLFAIRDFFINSIQGDVLGRASSYWLLIDRDTKRPKPMQNITDDLLNPDLSAINHKLQKITPPEKADYHSQKKVEYSDIDLNGHVNNIRYSEWIINTIPAEILQTRKIKFFEINYLSEVKLGESVQIELGDHLDKENLISGRILHKDNEACRIRLKFKSVRL